MEVNPYAAPTTDPTVEVTAAPDAEAVRKQHLNHEASLKGVGMLYILGGIIVTLIMLSPLLLALTAGIGAIEVAVALALVALGVFQIWAGINLRKLRRKARIPAIILAAIGLIGFPIGTIISVYFLYLLLCEKGNRVLSEDYRQVVAATPHIRYKTSIVVWILLGLVLLAFATTLVMAFL